MTARTVRAWGTHVGPSGVVTTGLCEQTRVEQQLVEALSQHAGRPLEAHHTRQVLQDLRPSILYCVGEVLGFVSPESTVVRLWSLRLLRGQRRVRALVLKSTCPLLASLIKLTASVSGKHSSSAPSSQGQVSA